MDKGYDYIIVGGGSAGYVIANRLSADPAIKVLLVEAGARDWNPLLRVPLLATFWLRKKYHNWGYQTEPERHLNNRRIDWPRGKVLGGSSAINGMVYTRGNRGDYDHWAQLGLREWSYDKVLPFFRKSENFEEGTSAFHGGEGELPVTRTPTVDDRYDAFVEAGRQAGFRANPDFNGASQDGFGRFHFTIKNGERWSAARSFITPVLERKNLTVLTNAHLLRVVLANGRATGVAVKTGSGTSTLTADQEVILCCGAITSPTALMLSGIGPADELRRLGIDVQVDSPQVGRGLQDHLTVRCVHASKEPDRLFGLRRMDRAALAVLRAMLTKTGDGTVFPLEGGAFLKSRAEVEYPDLQIHFYPGVPATTGLRVPFQKTPPGVHDGYGYGGTICQLRPESRGEIRLRSADPFASPVIRANYLSTETDRLTMRAGFKIMRDILQQQAFAKFNGHEYMPGPQVQSDSDIDAYIAANANTVYHPVGTCRMGMDEQSVVDGQLRVRGVEGLRISDASIMPTLVSANTNAPTIMIAEKTADMILRGAA
jgi:choline dehydrogenase